MRRALLLNADWTPMHFLSEWRALRLLMPDEKGKIRAEIVYDFQTGDPAFWNEAFTSPGPTPDAPLREFKIPATIRLRTYVQKKWKPARFRKHVLFNRDAWKCQYCGVKLNNNTIEIEHIMPSSRGGVTSWLNCVAACKPCNKRKANKTPEEAGMKLLKKPAAPQPIHFWNSVRSESWHDSWSTFITRIDE